VLLVVVLEMLLGGAEFGGRPNPRAAALAAARGAAHVVGGGSAARVVAAVARGIRARRVVAVFRVGTQVGQRLVRHGTQQRAVGGRRRRMPTARVHLLAGNLNK